MQKQAVYVHFITLAHAVPLMKRNRSIVEITDVKDYGYRGSLYYSLTTDLAGYNNTALSL
ncbi:hypothetical protein R3398_10580 [Rossellomorea marisflavi]|uniref:hypothetical protein n=1 Tax=Rossellomorea marisflavi TaxID=189381 RepID=UPI0006F24055|nr:hypothetical protein [Rossellomorea marisflavi]KQU60075.1 hypothetical protein ASG66_10390 [Bacillus sp. Leaf406]MDW4526819.1 hypothetical protein [Rossellomorea marisflavi]UKS63544.1 hypothetical protein K6T23_11725 [Rossellomorea marisflavi]WJV16816.1 hypothetical protein QU593_11550 [Rossellomorea marisflavi]